MKATCRNCGASLKTHRAPILEPISMKDLNHWLKGDMVYRQRADILRDALYKNEALLMANPMTPNEIYDDLFGNVQFIDRQDTINGIALSMFERGYRQDGQARFVLRAE